MNKSYEMGKTRNNNISQQIENNLQNTNNYININENLTQNDRTFQTL